MKTDPVTSLLEAKAADEGPVDWRRASDRGGGMRELEQVVRGFRHVHESTRTSPAPRPHLFDFGHLQVIAKIGSGATGDVYRAYDRNLDLYVALKLRRAGASAATANLLDEARCLAKVRQANVVNIYGAALIDGQIGIWMELVRGSTLETLLVRDGAFDADDVRSIGVELCRALEAVHRSGFVHGDIKLQNIMREDGGRTVLLDFGVARDFRRGADPFVSGTLNYVAPEVLRGEAATPASDQYSLGVALYRLLTGRFPHDGEDYNGLLAHQQKYPIVSVSKVAPHVPRRIAKAIDRSLSIDPAQRFGSIKLFSAQLNETKPARAWFGSIAGAAVLAMAIIAIALWQRQAPAAWETHLQFYRINAEGRQPVDNGGTLVPGDRLVLDFQTTKPTYLYVLDADAGHAAELLFPKAEMSPANPLDAGTDYTVPGTIANVAYKWKIEKGLASDEFVVIASTEKLTQLDDAASAHAPNSVTRSATLVPENNIAVDRSTLTEFLRERNIDAASANAFDGRLRYWRFVFPHPHAD